MLKDCLVDITIVWGSGVMLGFVLLLVYFRFHQRVKKIPFIGAVFFALIWPVTVVVILSVWTVNGLLRAYRIHSYRKISIKRNGNYKSKNNGVK